MDASDVVDRDRRQYLARRAGRAVGIGTVLIALGVLVGMQCGCTPAQGATGASWFDKAIRGICSVYPYVQPYVLRAADGGAPASGGGEAPVSEMDAGVDAQ